MLDGNGVDAALEFLFAWRDEIENEDFHYLKNISLLIIHDMSQFVAKHSDL